MDKIPFNDKPVATDAASTLEKLREGEKMNINDKDTYRACGARIQELEAEIADWRDAVNRAPRCDEAHCSCVGPMQKRIEKLESRVKHMRYNESQVVDALVGMVRTHCEDIHGQLTEEPQFDSEFAAIVILEDLGRIKDGRLVEP